MKENRSRIERKVIRELQILFDKYFDTDREVAGEIMWELILEYTQKYGWIIDESNQIVKGKMSAF
jgi:hypothetical protein